MRSVYILSFIYDDSLEQAYGELIVFIRLHSSVPFIDLLFKHIFFKGHHEHPEAVAHVLQLVYDPQSANDSL